MPASSMRAISSSPNPTMESARGAEPPIMQYISNGILWFRRRERGIDMPHRGFDGGQNDIKADIDQIHAGQRNYQIATENDALVQHMIEDINQRHLIVGIVVAEDNAGRLLCHQSDSTRDTNE